MSAARVVIVFASRRGATERLAMAAAVGAVEQRAEIRLRRLPDSADGLPPEGGWLAKEYVPPRDADAAWADTLIFLAPDWLDASSADLRQYLASLASLRQRGRWNLRTAAVMAADAIRGVIEHHLAGLGLKIVPVPDGIADAEAARLAGRAAAATTT
jgi:multimeric flavodoxin WrbA